jgi:hypothetical protein
LFGELVDVKGAAVGALHAGLDRGEVLYDLSPLIISTVKREEHEGVRQPVVIELPVLN